MVGIVEFISISITPTSDQFIVIPRKDLKHTGIRKHGHSRIFFHQSPSHQWQKPEELMVCTHTTCETGLNGLKESWTPKLGIS
jgi:hypothetical protein